MKKVLIINFLIFTILIGFLCTNVLAVTVTEEALENSFKKIMESNNNSEDNSTSVSATNMTIDKENKQIKFVDGTEVLGPISYDLSTLTFTSEITTDNTTTYEQWQNKQAELLSPMLMYILVADIYGGNYEDSMFYFIMNTLGSTLNDIPTSNTKYTITETDDVVTITDENGNKIPVENFPKYAVDIAKDSYQKEQSFTDSDKNNTFNYMIKIKESSENSCTIQASLIITPDADFSKLNGYANDTMNQLSNSIISGLQNTAKEYENAMKEENKILQNYLNYMNSMSSNTSKLPQTGDSFDLKDGLYILCATSFIALVYIVFKAIKYRNIE